MPEEKKQSVIYERRPFHRRLKDNPYQLLREEKTGKCYVRFRDVHGIVHMVGVSQEVYDAFNQFELDDLSYLNEVSRHHARESLEEAEAGMAAGRIGEQLEAVWLRNIIRDELESALRKLPERQRRRLLLHDMVGLTYQEIARMEHCSPQAAARSAEAARKKVRKLLAYRE